MDPSDGDCDAWLHLAASEKGQDHRHHHNLPVPDYCVSTRTRNWNRPFRSSILFADTSNNPSLLSTAWERWPRDDPAAWVRKETLVVEADVDVDDVDADADAGVGAVDIGIRIFLLMRSMDVVVVVVVVGDAVGGGDGVDDDLAACPVPELPKKS